MRRRMAKQLMSLAGFVVLAIGCANEGSFASESGNVEKKAPPEAGGDRPGDTGDQQAKLPPKAPSGQPDPVTGPCGKGGVTKVHLLSPSVQSGAPASHLDYEISAVDCEGNPISVTAGTIDFDLGAYTELGQAPLPYTSIGGTKDQRGVLEAVSGQDLFGNKGDKYQFFRTSQALTLSTDTKSIKIRIELNGTTIEPYTSEDIQGGTVATYLRFGDAAPVKQSVQLLP